MVTVTEVVETCGGCPSQWEGKTSDGRRIYVRYRWGCLEIGLGSDLEEAISSRVTVAEIGDGLDGCLSYDELREYAFAFEWPERCGYSEFGG